MFQFPVMALGIPVTQPGGSRVTLTLTGLTVGGQAVAGEAVALIPGR